jgi:hypothetical protein
LTLFIQHSNCLTLWQAKHISEAGLKSHQKTLEQDATFASIFRFRPPAALTRDSPSRIAMFIVISSSSLYTVNQPESWGIARERTGAGLRATGATPPESCCDSFATFDSDVCGWWRPVQGRNCETRRVCGLLHLDQQPDVFMSSAARFLTSFLSVIGRYVPKGSDLEKYVQGHKTENWIAKE